MSASKRDFCNLLQSILDHGKIGSPTEVTVGWVGKPDQAMDDILAKRAEIFNKYETLRLHHSALPVQLKDFQVRP